MHFFRNRNRPRSSFDIKVGRFHLLEVTVHLVTHRRSASHRKSLRNNKLRANDNTAYQDEWDWYEANREEINGEFLELLEASVFSRMFGKELEDFHQKNNPSVLPQECDEFDGIGSKNKAGGNNKRKRKGNTATSKKQSKTKLKGLPAIVNKDEDDGDQKPDKDVYFSFGKLIQLAYKKQPIKYDKSSWTILFRSNRGDDKSESKNDAANSESKTKSPNEAASFHDRKKLSSRLLVWISKSDAAAAASSEGRETMVASRRPGEGIYRSEMIPISSLFRKPKELMDLSDDEED